MKIFLRNSNHFHKQTDKNTQKGRPDAEKKEKQACRKNSPSRSL